MSDNLNKQEIVEDENPIVVNQVDLAIEELDCDMWGQNSNDPNYMSQPYWALLEEQYGR